jgi:hypothetical protein
VSIFNVVFGCILIGLWIEFSIELQIVMADMAGLHRPDTALGLETYGTDDPWNEFHHHLVRIEEEVAVAIERMRSIRYVGGLNCIVLLTRFLKTWQDIPALRVVAVTLALTLKRMASFGIIMIILLCLFAGSGMLMFGQILEEFHTFYYSVVTCAIIFCTADMTVYKKQQIADPVAAAVWTILFILVMYFILINMILAIIVEAYEEAMKVQHATQHSNTQTLKHSNTQTLKHSNTQTLKHSNTHNKQNSKNQKKNKQTLKHTNTQHNKHSNTQTLKHSNTHTLKHSNTQTH